MKLRLSYLFILTLFGLLEITFALRQSDYKKSTNETSNIYSNTTTLEGGKKGDAYAMNVNNIYMPINSSGTLAAINVDPYGSNGKYPDGNGNDFLYAGGFYLSGLKDSTIWANGVAPASLIIDYMPGGVKTSNDNNAQLYVLQSNDDPFSQSWIDWIDAVELGADFYDGDGDGVYTPVDKNNNGEWDLDEDRPDLVGDETVWTIYNDGVYAGDRRWNTVSPIGIQIKQTIWAYASAGDIGNVMYVRYRIEYVGIDDPTEPEQLDDVYFSAWSDPDIGGSAGFGNDLVGVDTSRNAGFAYNDGDDPQWGSAPPCFMIDFLLGPPIYIPGETFYDANGNGIYDENEIAYDTAYSNRGQVLGLEKYPGAENLGVSSSVFYVSSDPDLGDPDNKYEGRNYMLGFDKVGNPADPCGWHYGEVFGDIDCDSVDNKFWFSGDPVTQTGWINTRPNDQRFMQNTGPFVLKKGQEKEIIVAYVLGIGTDPINSITEARRIDDLAQFFFDNNFDETTDVKPQNEVLTNTFNLFQNYPNPFNPTTKIKYEIPKSVHVQLKVYDILGREIATLVNEQKPAGSYEVEFNASNLSNGVYFYELRTGDFRNIKKLVLLK